MGKKHLSLIVIPHTKTTTRTLSFSKRVLRLAIWGGSIVAILLLAVTADYLRIKLSNQSYSALKAENLSQKDAIREYQAKMGSLESKVIGFDEYVRKLNVMAGITSDQKLHDFNVGDYPRGEEASQNAGPIPAPGAQMQSLQNKTDDIQRSFDTLATFFESNASFLASQPSIWPTNGWASSGFGPRMDPFTQKQAFHYGLDISTAFGNPIVAPADGFVAEVNRSAGPLGNSIILSHGGGLMTLYAHLSKINVVSGQKVKRGDVIGNVGSTGKSIGPHLHYEVRMNGKPVNPSRFILD